MTKLLCYQYSPNTVTEIDHVITSLDKSKEYVFETAALREHLPCKPECFLFSVQANQPVISISLVVDSKTRQVWSTKDGWDKSYYAELMSLFASMIDKSVTVNPEFITQALNDQLTVIQAVNSWFIDMKPIIRLNVYIFEPVSFNIDDSQAVERVYVPSTSPFNGESCKITCWNSGINYGINRMEWKEDLVTSIKNQQTSCA
jgi:hypothetical protein